MTLKIGSLFSGCGGLDEAAREVFGATTAWVSDIDKGACKILAHRYPDIPNLGDITTTDWSTVEPVDIITGGSPCQDLSHAGKRAGMTDGTRSNLWVAMREAIAELEPTYVIWENVRGAYSAAADSALEHCPGCMGDRRPGTVLRALGRVLGDLSDLGYDAGWHGLRAADVGAPHGRFRVFVLAWRRDAANTQGDPRWFGHGDDVLPRRNQIGRAQDTGTSRSLTLLPSPRTSDTNGAGHHGEGGMDLRTAVTLLPTPSAADALGGHERRGGARGDELLLNGVAKYELLPTPMVGSSSPAAHGQISGDFRAKFDDALAKWGDYGPAVARWESATGMAAPSPTEPTGRGGAHRLSPKFTEWMMGLPAGWITDVPGITRNEALKACGNGVVPQQAAAALRVLLDHISKEVAA